MSHLSFLLPWAVTGLIAAAITDALSTRAICGWGRMPLFTRKDNPVDYWIAVGVGICFGVGMASVAMLQ